MKFLLVGSSPDQGGAETHFIALAQALIEAGHSVCAAVRPDSFLDRQLQALGVRPHSLRLRNVLDIRSHRMLDKVCRQERPDALVANFGRDYWPLILLGKRLGIPVAVFRHRIDRMKPFSNYALPRLARRFYAVSEYARKVYLDYGMPAERVQVMYNPINLRRYRTNPEQGQRLRRSLGIPHDALVVGYCGRLLDSKGIFALRQALELAMASEPRLHCLWVGDDIDGARLRGEVGRSAHADRHRFAGRVDDVHDYYSAFSMLAFPSLAPETFGRVSIEAQACGVPVIGSRIGGIPETLRPGASGILLAPGDTQAWSNAILEMCDPAVRAPMANAGRAFVEGRFSTRVIANQLVSSLNRQSPGLTGIA